MKAPNCTACGRSIKANTPMVAINTATTSEKYHGRCFVEADRRGGDVPVITGRELAA